MPSSSGFRGLAIVVMGLALLTVFAVPAFAQTGAQRPDAPTYAQRGPWAVGTRDFTIEDGQGAPLSATVWYPALNPDGLEERTTYSIAAFTLEGRALRDAVPDTANGPYPLVLFSHGNRGVRLQSLFLTEHLASYGMVVIAVDHPGNTLIDFLLNRANFGSAVLTNFALRPLDLLRVIAYVDGLDAAQNDLRAAIDTNRIAVMGHSFGGYTALGVGGARLNFDGLAAWCANPLRKQYQPGPELADVPLPRSDQASHQQDFDYACLLAEAADQVAALRGLEATPAGLWPSTTDPRVAALVLMAPATGPIYGPEGLASVSAPALVIVGSEDQTTSPLTDAYPVYEQIGSRSKALLVFENADHYIFVDDCPAVARSLGLFDECSDKVWDMARVHDLINHVTTAFLLSVLSGDADASAALEPEAVDFVGTFFRRMP